MALQRKQQASQWTGWQNVRAKSVSSRIIEQVWDALFRGELKSGDRLGSEVELAQKLGVSRVPVRDAFRTLEALGIIAIKVGARGGAFIAEGDPQRFADALAVQLKLVGISIEEMFDSQIAIETMAAELAAQRATKADLATLRELIDELETLCTKPLSKAAALKFTRTSMQFHEALVDAAHNRALAAQFKALRIVMEPVYLRRTSDAVAKRVIASHNDVFNSIAKKDAESARTLMRRRLEVIRAHQLMKAVEAPST
jgi:DNA-binding FadR family transcriptional regulator